MAEIMKQVSTYLNPQEGSRDAHLKIVAIGSGVPYDTLAKIANGRVKNPRVNTVQKILDHKEQKPPSVT